MDAWHVYLLICFPICRTHHLTAESLSLAEDWVRVLQNVIQRNALRSMPRNVLITILCQLILGIVLRPFSFSVSELCWRGACISF